MKPGRIALAGMLLALAACGSAPVRVAQRADSGEAAPAPPRASSASSARVVVPADPDQPVMPAAGSGRGGYYQDDGPGDAPPAGLKELPDAEPKLEPINKRTNKPYTVLGTTYTPLGADQEFTQRGVASWYGKKFHGQRTASGELYDMYKMTAAHPTLPIPSYVRITNTVNGKQVIVRVNDRGPFHSDRIIDVSYTAALKLGMLGKGSHEVEIERLMPDEIERIAAARRNGDSLQASAKSTKAARARVAEDSGKAAREISAPAVAATPASQDSAPAEVAALLLDDKAPESAPRESILAPIAAVAPARVSSVIKDGFYLQFGAFSRADNAESVRARLASYADALGRLEVVAAGAVYRLFGGPFASRAEALEAARGLPAALGLKPLVVQR